jgi:hypothetical protein
MNTRWMRFATFVLLSLAALPAADARGETQILHGADSTFRSDSLGICWGIVQSPDTAALQVVIRIRVLDPAQNRFRSFAVKAFHPFTGAAEWIAVRQTLEATNDIITPREDFKRLGGRRILFYADATGPADQAPDLIVEYLGIPDTSPQFSREDELEAYFGMAFDRLTKP